MDCGHHVTSDQLKFTHLQDYKGKYSIVTAHNSVHSVKKEGIIRIENDEGKPITLNSEHLVLLGPQDVKFLKNVESIIANVVHTGKRIEDLHVLFASNSYVKTSSNDNVSIWHARLGHVNLDKLNKVMVHKNLVHGMPKLMNFCSEEICEDSQYGKLHRLPLDKPVS